MVPIWFFIFMIVLYSAVMLFEAHHYHKLLIAYRKNEKLLEKALYSCEELQKNYENEIHRLYSLCHDMLQIPELVEVFEQVQCQYRHSKEKITLKKHLEHMKDAYQKYLSKVEIISMINEVPIKKEA